MNSTRYWRRESLQTTLLERWRLGDIAKVRLVEAIPERNCTCAIYEAVKSCG